MKLDLQTDVWRLYSYHEIEEPIDDNIDVFVEWNGCLYTCTVFTIANVASLMRRWVDTGEHRTPFFWASNAIIVPKLDLNTLNSVIDDLVDQQVLDSVMLRVRPDT